MDRRTVYYGQLALEVDTLYAGRFAMTGLAMSDQATFGTATVVDGLTVTPATPASLSVIVGSGSIYQQANLESSSWSSLAADTHTVLKQGVNLDTTTFAITPPGTAGYSQVFLVEAQYADLDSGSTVLPYFNAALPSSPFSGPGNAGTAQNTVRKGVVALQVKAGTAAATGSQVSPTADAGWTPLYYVTVANGATTITSGNIVMAPLAPFILTKLPYVPSDSQTGKWLYARDTGTANNLVVTLSPVPAAIVEGMQIRVKLLNAISAGSVINVNGTGNKTILRADGNTTSGGDGRVGEVLELIYDGTVWQKVGGSTSQALTLIAARDYYVNASTGLDTNDGLTTGTAFRTIQKGVTTVGLLNLNGYTATVHAADGTYSESVQLPTVSINGAAILAGNDTTFANCFINSPLGTALVTAQPGSNWTVHGFKLVGTAQAGDNGNGLWVTASGRQISYYNMEFGAVPGSHVNVTGGGALALSVGTGIRISGGASAHATVSTGGNWGSGSAIPVTLVGTPNFSAAFVYATSNGNASFAYSLVSGSATGAKYYASANGTISSIGNGVNYYPGNTAGTTVTGGQYV